MDGRNSFRPAKKRTDAILEVVQGIAVFGEDNELAAVPMRVEHFRLVLQQLGKLVPFAVGLRLAHGKGGLFQISQDGDFSLQFSYGLRGGREIDHLLFGGLQFVFWGVFQIIKPHRRKILWGCPFANPDGLPAPRRSNSSSPKALFRRSRRLRKDW